MVSLKLLALYAQAVFSFNSNMVFVIVCSFYHMECCCHRSLHTQETDVLIATRSDDLSSVLNNATRSSVKCLTPGRTYHTYGVR